MTFLIKSIQFYPYRFAFREPWRTARETIYYREGWIVEIGDNELRTGLGEASPLDGFGMESLVETEVVLKESWRSLINTKIRNLNDIENALVKYDRSPAAKHGLELALLHLLSQAQGLSVSQILANSISGKIRDFVPINAVIGAISPEKAAMKAKEYIDQGYPCLKIKVGTKDFEADLQRVYAVRSQGGNNIQIRVDANQGWSVDAAIANLKRLAFLNLEYVEQPVLASDLGGMAEVRRSQSIPIAADESVNNLAQLQRVIEAQAADIIILKPMALGGIITAKHAAMLAFQAGLDVVVTTTIDGAIARQAAFDLAAALPIQRACGLATGDLLIES
ncbi:MULTISPECIES: o-succinylbenzoate synthase [Pseudanabaena]|uniref:o-succinylbenzoate synthase n=2 Tax=Pseudanabaena TaxID=1152 RepID=L8N2F9_9CYAN|nr:MULTISPECIES: o-succinylbenzoate synthase [Pseudanabaena]ELS33876.1 o-succinylbenzoic acid (OSB) synthetase [Pseudanabaena biceps PCC 7429]MDG3493903.1 o-succinylbenzoate synthase [Pseudanabaena catenata USMAC16]